MIFIWKELFPVSVREVVDDIRVLTGLMEEIKDTGNNLMVTCPFHANGRERKPSCGISKEEVERNNYTHEAGTVHCYTCGYKADLPKFVMDMLELENVLEGFQWMKRQYFGIMGQRREIKLDFGRGVQKEREIVEINTEKYIRDLWKYDEGREYLRGRGITDEVMIRYEVGYCREDNAIVFFIGNKKGQVIFTKKRGIKGKIFKNSEGGDKAGNLYGISEIGKIEETEKIWVVESEIDVLTLAVWREKAVSIMGSSVTNKQLEILASKGIRTIIAGCDNDEAGRKGNRILKDKAIPKGFRVWNVDWKGIEGKDFNDLDEGSFRSLRLY